MQNSRKINAAQSFFRVYFDRGGIPRIFFKMQMAELPVATIIYIAKPSMILQYLYDFVSFQGVPIQILFQRVNFNKYTVEKNKV